MDKRKFTVCGVVFIEDKVLLVRHTYGVAKDRILLPGGHCNENEMPTDAIEREIFEETSVKTVVKSLISTIFKPDEWLMIFLMDYINGEPKTDGYENSEVLLLQLDEAIGRNDITATSKVILESIKNQHCKELTPSNFCTKSSTPSTFKMFGV